jgi:hypothetical protein
MHISEILARRAFLLKDSFSTLGVRSLVSVVTISHISQIIKSLLLICHGGGAAPLGAAAGAVICALGAFAG